MILKFFSHRSSSNSAGDGGGGGAGGVVYAASFSISTSAYSVVVGAGGQGR